VLGRGSRSSARTGTPGTGIGSPGSGALTDAVPSTCHGIAERAGRASRLASHLASARAPDCIAVRAHAPARSAAVPRCAGSRDSAIATASAISRGTPGFR